MQLIAQGAEAKIFLDGNNVVKERAVKSYRHPKIDSQLREFRTRREAKVLETLAKAGFPSPRVVSMDDRAGKLTIEKIEGKNLRDLIHQNPKSFGRAIGNLIGNLHNIGIVHGDPTTSNLIVANPLMSEPCGSDLKDLGKLYLIDFGLAQFSEKTEDRAVDLHLLERAIESAHHMIKQEVMEAALCAYHATANGAGETMKRLDAVKRRGRNKMKGDLEQNLVTSAVT